MVEKKGGGLIQEHRGDLNIPSVVYPGGKEARNVRLDELRVQYAGDPLALQQIDFYDGRTKYREKLRALIDALESGDTAQASELKAWFNEYYPDIV